MDAGKSSSGALNKLRHAMAEWVMGQVRQHPGAQRFDQRMASLIQRERTLIRAQEGGGGMCHLVSEFIDAELKYSRLAVTYLGNDGAPICAHYVNVLPGGSILDGTADQFGEGHDVRVVTPDAAEYGRYRPEFDTEFNPSNEPSLRAWRFIWTGESDWDAVNRVNGERGEAWWVTDLHGYRRYLEDQLVHASVLQHPGHNKTRSVEYYRRQLREVEDGIQWNEVMAAGAFR